MDQFQCFVCGVISVDQDKVSTHMSKDHSIKVEEDIVSRKYSCSLCNYDTRNMNDLKNHIIVVHKKEPHNWMVEDIQTYFKCDDCEIEFPRKSLLESHMDQTHSGDQGTSKKSNVVKEDIVLYEEKAVTKDKIFLTVGCFPCDCNICGELIRGSLHCQNHMKVHFEKVKSERNDTKEPFKLQTENGHTGSDSEDDDIPMPKFAKHGWGDNFPEQPTGINFKAKTTLFHHAVDNIKVLFKKCKLHCDCPMEYVYGFTCVHMLKVLK